MNYEIVAAGHAVATLLPTFDVETYSEAGYVRDLDTLKLHSLPGLSNLTRGLEAVGTRVYVEHHTFRLLCIAYDLRDGRGVQQWRETDPPPRELLEYVRSGGPFAAWNFGFEFTVWNWYCVPKLGWPELRLEQGHCDMAKARAFGLAGKLEVTGEVLNLAHKKHEDGKRLLKLFTVPRVPTKKDDRWRIRIHEEPEDGPKFLAYNRGDVEAEMEAGARIPDLTPEERAVWLTDQRINRRGIGVDGPAIRDAIAIVNQCFERFDAELMTIAGCVSSETAQLQGWLRGRGIHVENLEWGTVEATLKTLDPKTLEHRALWIRSMLASASIKKLFSMNAQAASDGRLHDLYAYHGAKPGRWTAYGPQPQNLFKGSWPEDQVATARELFKTRSLDAVLLWFPDPFEAINQCMRSFLIPAPGHDFICSDFSAIEAVGLAMLAGEQWRIDVFRGHGLIYEAAAERMGLCTVDEMVWHRRETGKHHPVRPRMKVAELASGYGGWIGAWKQFGADEIYKSDWEIKQAILAWREASPAIVEFWGGQSRGGFDRGEAYKALFGLEGAAVSAVLHPGTAFAYREISYQMHEDVLYCRLPSGRLICYQRPRLEPSRRDYANPWELALTYEGWNSNAKKGPPGWLRMSLYGGLLAENVTQGACRDLLAHALVNLDHAGYNPVLHSHDEPCGEVREGWGSVEEFEAIIMRRPTWAADWPVRAAGGWRGEWYRKAD